MKALVVGGAGSGKSRYAEQLACSLAPRRTYVATMVDAGREAKERIERHRAQRAGLDFETLECPDTLVADTLHDDARAATSGVVLLDDLGNLCANALFAPDGRMAEPDAVLDRLEREVSVLSRHYAHTVVVGNLVGSEGRLVRDETYVWVRLVGALCCRIAATFDTVVIVSAGIPRIVKGASS